MGARWMRMPCCTNQSSVPMAWKEFGEDGRMKPSSYRDRVVDVVEEFYKFTLVMREHANWFNDRFSERKEVHEKGALQPAETKMKPNAAELAEIEKLRTALAELQQENSSLRHM